MATYTTEVVRRAVHRWVVPAAEPWGAASDEITKAWGAAAVAYRKAHGLPDDASLPGDALWFHVRDDEVVIQFTTKQ
ncbi:hypothetical protein ABZV65_13810 [Streptomyces bauhiniae]|uniref:hypothetical protein n=1 Tax=Streptomyces bauhiniae TaxID=2340725 RepID=UPI0033A4B50F